VTPAVIALSSWSRAIEHCEGLCPERGLDSSYLAGAPTAVGASRDVPRCRKFLDIGMFIGRIITSYAATDRNYYAPPLATY